MFASAFLAASVIPARFERLSCNVQSPVPVVAVTAQVVPLPETDVMAGSPPEPLRTSVKLCARTPVTASLKVTVHVTVAALVGEAAARTIDVTLGAVVSSVTDCGPEVPVLPAASDWVAVRV